MACEEKNRLAMEYDVATSKFSEAVRELHRRIGTSPKDEYDRLERALSDAGTAATLNSYGCCRNGSSSSRSRKW
jgi:hypothetical protein